ncbi:MAG: GIY-YIG nuclease family protein [Akkermansiaceae bacterium]|jgi:putative endonuclease|nr:GIY-YIG nuclease family protein [Akkermansiaceae bacterium]|tara:strand:- start:561 stop:839 length:279 start_codon:yes stop_codon:yes gene_type:complete
MPDHKITWSVYLIQCGDSSLYCGMSNDVLRRFSEHQSQSPKCAKYLRGKAPLELVYQMKIGTRSEAAREEIRIKSLTRAAKIKLISGILTDE